MYGWVITCNDLCDIQHLPAVLRDPSVEIPAMSRPKPGERPLMAAVGLTGTVYGIVVAKSVHVRVCCFLVGQGKRQF